MSYQTDTGVLPDALLGKASELVQNLSKEQLLWLGGYLSGVGFGASNTSADVQQEVVSTSYKENREQTVETRVLKVLIGSHSGNGKFIGKALSELAQQTRKAIELHNMADYKPKRLKQDEDVLFIVSTHGEGEPPAQAEELFRFLGSKRAGDLSHLNYAVVALGDSSYKFFCQTGLDFHERLQVHGAKPLAEPFLLDVDFMEDISGLSSEVLKLYGSQGESVLPKQQEGQQITSFSDGLHQAEVLEKVLLNGKGSAKETYHIELDLEGSGLSYEPGDALEVYALNDEVLISRILSVLKFSGSEVVNHKGAEYRLKELLQNRKELTQITMPVLTKLSAFVDEPDLNRLLDNRDELDRFLDGTDLLDLLTEFSLQIKPQELVDALRSLPPRAYSIASSQSDVGEEVHLTVGAVRYTKNDREHEGVCSTYLIDRLKVGDKVAVRVKQNDGFRLPVDDIPIILISAGTGVAPYRSFLQERAERAASGQNWLVFGDQHFETDFLYQTEWLKYRKNGILTKIDVAFSRDQKDKIYVQDRLKQQGDEVYQWLERGAYVYVCGDRKKMAKDVQRTFIEIIKDKAGISTEEAEQRLLIYRQTGRYQEDVY